MDEISVVEKQLKNETCIFASIIKPKPIPYLIAVVCSEKNQNEMAYHYFFFPYLVLLQYLFLFFYFQNIFVFL